MSRADRALHILDTYILKPNKSRMWKSSSYKLLIELANALIGKEIEMIHSKVCPFCGRKFSKSGLIIHLKRTKWLMGFTRNPICKTYIYPKNSCAFNYYSMLSYVISVYTNIKPRVRTHTNGVYFDVTKDYTIRFDSLKEFMDYIKTHPEVITLHA